MINEDDKKQRHHDLVGLFDAVRAEKQRQQRAAHDDDVIRDDGIGLRGEVAKPRGGVGGHERADERVDQRLEDIRHDDGVADGDAHGACQRQPAERLDEPVVARVPHPVDGCVRSQ